MKKLLSFLLCLSAVVTALTPGLSAQTARPGVPDSADDEPLTLEVFTVQAITDGSYTAADSLTASRVRTDIKSLPYNVNVVTSEFIRDFAALDLTEELAYTSSFSYGQNQDTDYSLRGMLVNTQLRNGFRSEVFRNSLTTERVEVIKGPSAAIYGQASPGGVINTITKRPKTVQGGSVRLSLGNYNYMRGELELTGPLGGPKTEGLFKDLYYLVTLSHLERDKVQKYAFDRQTQGSVTLTKKFGRKTSLTLEAEYLHNNFQRQVTVPLVSQTTVNGVVIPARFLWREIYEFQPSAPGAYDKRPQEMAFLTFEHEFNRTFSTRVAANIGRAPKDIIWFISPTSPILENPLRFTGRQPVWNEQKRTTRNFQADLIAQYQTGNLKHQTLFTIDHSFFRSERTDRRLPANLVNNATYNVPTLLVDSPNYFMIDYDPSLFTALSAGADNQTKIYGAFLRHQVTALNGRLIGMAALRYDYNKFNLRNPLTTTPADIFTRDALNPQLGLNFKVNDTITLYASRSESFIPPTSGANPSQVFGGDRPKNQIGLGYEAGIKATLFENRLNFTAAVYDIERQDVAITLWDDNIDQAYTVFAGLETSRGFEMDFNWRIGRGLQLFGGFGVIDTEIVDAGRDLDAIGRRPRSTPDHQGGIGLRLGLPREVLGGMVLTFGATYLADFNALAPLTGGIVGADGYIRTNNTQRNIVLPGYTLLSAGANYTFQTGSTGEKKRNHRIQLNFKNLADRKYVATNLRTSEGLSYIGSYSLSF
ncbi:MAG: TonB-dependent receptor [Opitutaceae bacterium]